jgi:hypothetical protein
MIARAGPRFRRATAINSVSIYQLMENGLALQATLQGTKYWKSQKLNTY